MFHIADKAKEKLNHLLKEEGNKGKLFRLDMKGMGWSGPKFDLVLDEPKENDNMVREEGIDFLLSPETALRIKLFKDIRIDYSDGVYTGGFKVKAGFLSGC